MSFKYLAKFTIFYLLTIVVLSKASFALTDVGKWKRFEVSYSNTTWNGNPFDLLLDGVFTHTGSEDIKTMPGFYAGNNTWKIFFMPDKLGEWKFATQSPDSDLNGKTGSFNCVTSGLPGQLVPVGNRWKLEDGGFTVPILIYTQGFLREENGYTDFNEFLLFARDTMGSPIIKQNMGVYNKPDTTEGGEVWAIKGEEFNIPMFDRMNRRYDALRDAGMGFYFFLYGDDEDKPPWGGQSIQEIRYFRYMIARFSAYSTVIWDTGTDIGEYRTNNWIDWFPDWFNQNDPYGHPVTSRTGGGSGGKHPNKGTYYSDGDDDLPAHSTLVNTWNSRSVPTAFTDNWHENVPRGGFDEHKIRRAVWEAGLVGGTAVSFGNNYTMDRTLPFPQTFQSAPYLGYAAKFFKQSISYLGTLDPHDELVVSGSSVVLSADPGKEYVAYLNTGGTVQIDLSAVSGTTAVEWYNPRTGVYSGQTTTGGGILTFTAADSNDWVLHIGGVPPDSTPPTNPQDVSANTQSESQINLTWQAVSDSESGISKYNIYRDGSNVGQSTTTTFSDTGLYEGTTYTYEVSAVNGAGMEGAKSTSVSATTLADTMPPAISSVSASGDSTIVTIVFSESVEQASATNASNYQTSNGIVVSNASLGSDKKTVTLTTSSHSDGVSYTLTVNNIKDRATTPNVIAANTQATYTFVAQSQLVVSNLTVASGKSYEVVQDGLTNGTLVYIDRSFTSSSVPVLVQGDTYIKTANNDKGSSGASFLTFDVNQNVTIYVGHDNRITTKPSWMATFTDTGEDIVTSDATFSLFAKDFPSGTVTLGGNEGGGNSMYTVIITGQGTGDTTPPAIPSDLKKDE
jgi:Fibronectin type III domain.